MGDKVRINFDVDMETYEIIKTLASMRGKTVSKFFVELVKAYAQKNAAAVEKYKELQSELTDL